MGFESVQAIPTAEWYSIQAYERAHPGDGLRELLTGKLAPKEE